MSSDAAAALQPEIDQAKAAGNMGRANSLYQRQLALEAGVPAVSQEPGPSGEADSEGGESLPAEISTPPPLSTELVEQALGAYGDVDADEVAELRREWPGTEMAENLGYLKWFITEYVPSYMIEELPDDIASLRVGAAIARELFHRHHMDAGERTEGARNMSEIAAENFDERTGAMMGEAAAAREAGNGAKANRLEREIRAMFVQRYGTGPVVGTSGGPTT